MMNNIIYFFWSVVIGDFFVIGSVDDFLKRYKFIYILLIFNEYYFFFFFGNLIFCLCRYELIK